MDVGNLINDDSFSKLHKNVAIAKSGIYQYHRSELDGLFGGNAEIPGSHLSRSVFNVYRPPEVLKDAKSLFIQLPLTRQHPNDFVTPENIRDESIDWIGWTGDSSKIVVLESDEEVTINSTLNIVDSVGLKAYDSGIREVSPGYIADFIWKDGVDKNGTAYQIVMTKIKEVNHLALVDQGRGGKDASILDSKNKENKMDEKTVLGFIQKSLKGMFGKEDRVLDSMPKNMDKFSDEQKDYLLKETHRLLQHRVSGKSFDSFLPLGYTKDELPEVASDSFPVKEKEAEDALPFEKKDEEKKEETEDALPVEENKEEVAEDSAAEKVGGAAELSIEPIKPSGTGSVETVTPQPSARDSVTVKIQDSKPSVNSEDPFAIMNQIRNGFKVTTNKEIK